MNPKDYWENRLENNFGVHGVGYVGLGRQYNCWVYRVKKNVFLRTIKQINPDICKADVLDVGCGTGFYVERWKALGVRKVAGIDITRVAIEKLKKMHPDCEFYQMDIGSNTVEKAFTAHFDFVSAFDILFHIIDDELFKNAIHNIYKLLKPGGFFVWSDLFLHGKTFRSDSQVCRNIHDIEAVLTEAGFQITGRYPMLCLMNTPADTKNRFLWILWRCICSLSSRTEIAGFIIGGLLYPLEVLLSRLLSESPTTEIMICKKVADH